MPDHNNITLDEVYRAVKAMDARWEKAFAENERGQHTLRNRQEAAGLKVAVLEQRVQTVEGSVRDIYGAAGKIALGISTVVGLAFQAISMIWKRS